MGWLDRFNKQSVNLSTTNVPSGGASEIGVAGESIIGGYEDTEARVDKLSVKDYVAARQNDGTLASLYNIPTLPILGVVSRSSLTKTTPAASKPTS